MSSPKVSCRKRLSGFRGRDRNASAFRSRQRREVYVSVAVLLKVGSLAKVVTIGGLRRDYLDLEHSLFRPYVELRKLLKQNE